MRAVATIFAIVSFAVAQEIGFTDGPSIADGPNAISNPNINNGWQADSSLFSGGSAASGGSVQPETNVFNDIVGSTFTSINSNSAFKDNIVNNPSKVSVSGNEGWTANGDGNHLGAVENVFSGARFVRRGGDVVFASNHHQIVSPQPQIATFPATHVIRPVVSAAGYAPAAALSRRNGDVVFAGNHHQVNAAAGFVPESVPVVFSAPAHFVQPVFVQSPAYPAASEGKATIIQNKA
ncbi:hypothetical protein J3B02_004574 [Coemansia erecta]|uniref:Uncharacterized protein n=1 Tax=Coemansia asiatica TaxID=1052880 RepID=A0A9W7XK15_9FUNG|nr:hypothetical protein LPJ64_002207 [Coemansia asiatica]KAJ2845823.1 hypothetical protein J3B02_004574 [Coemansia erecta]KAJ2859564.1 hypothetical protein FB639_005758 [Coemansia asiatica]